MLTELYKNFYKGVNVFVAGLQLVNLPSQMATLEEIMQNNKVQHPPIINLEQKQQTNLESFLYAQYQIRNDEDITILQDTVKLYHKIGHYHSLGEQIIIKGRKPEFVKQLFLESVLIYFTANEPSGKKLHIIEDYMIDYMLPDKFGYTSQYTVILPEGEKTAIVIEQQGKFDERHFKWKISIYLENKRRK